MAWIIPIAWVLFTIVVNVYTVLRFAKQKRIEGGNLTAGVIHNKTVHYDPRGWARGFIDYSYDAPVPSGGTQSFKMRRRVRNGLLQNPKPGDRIEVRYVPEDPALSNIEDNGAQMMGWIFASVLMDAVLVWAIFMVVTGGEESA